MSDARDRVEHLANAVSMLRPSFAGAHIDAAAMLRAQHEEITRLRAALSAPPPVVPAGWQLVPVEPHPRLLNVLFGYWLDPVNNLKHRAIAAAEWRSMLAAVPQAPTQRNPADNQSQPQR